jgi:hypothetical protein
MSRVGAWRTKPCSPRWRPDGIDVSEYTLRVSVELHVYPGVPYASDALAPNAEYSRRAILRPAAGSNRWVITPAT